MEKTTINEQDAAGCDGNQNTTIRVNLLVPSVPPTDYTSSNIIKVVYVLHVSRSITTIMIFLPKYKANKKWCRLIN